VLLAGNHAGKATSSVAPGESGGAVWNFTYEFNDRGRGPNVNIQAVVDRHGMPTRLDVKGFDYFKNAVAEHFDLADGKASWKNPAETGQKEFFGRAFYFDMEGSPLELGLLARALLQGGDRMALLPDGNARIEQVKTSMAKGPGFSRTVHLYEITGLGIEPNYIWLDDHQAVFAIHDGWQDVILDGWQGALAALGQDQDQVSAGRDKQLASRLAHRPEDHLVIRNARLFDPETMTSRPGMTVVVAGDRIEKVGPDREVDIPAGADIVRAGGKMLLPGLWDMHVHLSPVCATWPTTSTSSRTCGGAGTAAMRSGRGC
jgi:hypothetical protein